MRTVAAIDARIRAVDACYKSTVRHLAEIERTSAAGRDAQVQELEAERAAAVAAAAEHGAAIVIGWLCQRDISAYASPKHAPHERTPDAVRSALRRAMKHCPGKTMTMGGRAYYAVDWLRDRGLIL